MESKNFLPPKLNVNQQLLAAQVFNQVKQASKNEDDFMDLADDDSGEDDYDNGMADNYLDNDNALTGAMQSFERVATSGKTSVAIQEGIKLGSNLRANISSGRFDGSTFLTVLVLSLIKDFCDFADLGAVIGPIINIFISLTLFLVFFMRSSTLKKYLIKRFAWPVIIEFIPFFSVFPTYTIMTILLKLKVDHKINKLKDTLKQVTGHIHNLKKATQS